MESRRSSRKRSSSASHEEVEEEEEEEEEEEKEEEDFVLDDDSIFFSLPSGRHVYIGQEKDEKKRKEVLVKVENMMNEMVKEEVFNRLPINWAVVSYRLQKAGGIFQFDGGEDVAPKKPKLTTTVWKDSSGKEHEIVLGREAEVDLTKIEEQVKTTLNKLPDGVNEDDAIIALREAKLITWMGTQSTHKLKVQYGFGSIEVGYFKTKEKMEEARKVAASKLDISKREGKSRKEAQAEINALKLGLCYLKRDHCQGEKKSSGKFTDSLYFNFKGKKPYELRLGHYEEEAELIANKAMIVEFREELKANGHSRGKEDMLMTLVNEGLIVQNMVRYFHDPVLDGTVRRSWKLKGTSVNLGRMTLPNYGKALRRLWVIGLECGPEWEEKKLTSGEISKKLTEMGYTERGHIRVTLGLPEPEELQFMPPTVYYKTHEAPRRALSLQTSKFKNDKGVAAIVSFGSYWVESDLNYVRSKFRELEAEHGDEWTKHRESNEYEDTKDLMMKQFAKMGYGDKKQALETMYWDNKRQNKAALRDFTVKDEEFKGLVKARGGRKKKGSEGTSSKEKKTNK